MKKSYLLATLVMSTLILAACNQEAPSPNAAQTENGRTQVNFTENMNNEQEPSETSPLVDPAEESVMNDGTEFTLEEVMAHDSQDDCYTAIDGKVYDLTPFISSHPGGEQNIMKVCGKDGSEMFGGKHGANEEAKAELATHQIGTLVN